MNPMQIPADCSYLSITFPAAHDFTIHTEKKGLSAVLTDGVLTVQLFYSFSPTPLRLSAAVAGDECAQLTICPERIALFVLHEGNAPQLCDEEWPCGIPLFANGTICSDDLLQINTGKPKAIEAPAITRSFCGIEQMRPQGVNVGDCMPFSELNAAGDGEVYHLFYLYDRHHHRSKWGFGAHQWAHISTRDFTHWAEHPMAISITAQWEGSICTGSMIAAENRFYAWYAVRMMDHSPARLTYAVSEDCIHFVKSEKFFTLPPAYDTRSARDPKIFFFDGRYHLLITTTQVSTHTGCIAHFSSAALDDWEGWQDCGAIYLSPNDSQPECPDWFAWNGYYYLVVGLHGQGFYYLSDTPFGPWRTPEKNEIPCGRVPKSALLGSRRIFSGFAPSDAYADSLVTAEAHQRPDGTLWFD